LQVIDDVASRDNPRRPAAVAGCVRLVIADDHQTVREGLRASFASIPYLYVIDEVADTDAVVALARTLAPDVVVMDLSMPPIGGLAAIRRIKAEAPQVAVVVLTRHSDPSFVGEALMAGASAYVLKQSAFSELRGAIEAVVRGERYFDTRLTATLNRLAADEMACLSSRERDVLRRTALGQSNKRDLGNARHFHSNSGSAKTHGMRKLALRDRSDLVRYAAMQGWLSEP
jgi:DNA-binding NarL/FixJ family response regulator